MATCNKLLDALFLPILLYSFEVWGTYDTTDAKKWGKDPIEKIHTQFYKHFIGLNIRATIITCRNEAGRLSLKSHININVIKFSIGYILFVYLILVLQINAFYFQINFSRNHKATL